MTTFATVPMQSIGPVKILGNVIENEEIMVPLATYESPVWPSTNRGAKVSREAGGILVTLIDERMARSVAVEATNAQAALQVWQDLQNRFGELQALVKQTSRFAQLIDIHSQIIANILYIRFEYLTGDAAGHNMVTKASDQLLQWILKQYPELRYISVSGNYCTDKKVSAVNGILGRGKNVVCEIIISKEICQRVLKTTPEKIVEINIKKNLLGTMAAGAIRAANAHFANILLAFYLATGQDAANIIEGSQGFVHAEIRGEDLYFSITVPNIIVGTIGNGKDLPFVQENLALLNCVAEREPGQNGRRLAVICAATIMCCELSLLAALTNPGELMRTHELFERKRSE